MLVRDPLITILDTLTYEADQALDGGEVAAARELLTLSKVVLVAFEPVSVDIHSRKIKMSRSPGEDVVAPSWHEMDACLRELEGWKWKLGVFLRYTGLRVAETMLLRWENINLRHSSVRIAREISKTKHGRYIPLSPHLVEELSGWGMREGWVIPYDGKQERRKAALAKYFNAAWASSEIREEAWRRNSTKAFRKGFKSGMLNLAPAHADAIDYLQGHKLGKGSRSAYIDPWQALPLRETVALIPKITEAPGLTVRDGQPRVRAEDAETDPNIQFVPIYPAYEG